MPNQIHVSPAPMSSYPTYFLFFVHKIVHGFCWSLWWLLRLLFSTFILHILAPFVFKSWVLLLAPSVFCFHVYTSNFCFSLSCDSMHQDCTHTLQKSVDNPRSPIVYTDIKHAWSADFPVNSFGAYHHWEVLLFKCLFLSTFMIHFFYIK